MTDSRTLGQRVPKEGLFLMDGIEGLRSLPKHSVDMLLTDPPYGTTRNYWDVPLPLPELWEAVKWAVKPNGAVLFFAQCPFDKVLGASNLAMLRYGYTDSNMLPLTKERALELMERDVTVYMLHTDNTEAMAFDADEIRSFDGIFGVEVSEWETVKDRFAPQDYEKAFLDNPADSFAIYQLRDNDDTARLHYMNSEYLEKKGLSVQKENYAAVYAGNLDRRGDTQDKLNGLYETFNIRRPEDFRGHSLSVSDIVALKQNGVVSCHYADSWGFKELPGFLKPENYLKNAEMAMEDDFGMIDGIINNGPRKTVAELEEQSKTGKPISLLELAQAVHREDEEKHRAQQPVRREKPGEKPSILAKLKAPSVADTKSVKSAPKRSAEREL